MKANEFIIAPENAGKSIVEIMQLFSDQQNKELREAMLNLQSECGYLQKFKDGVDTEIQRLTKENDDLRDNASEYIKELTRLRELLGRVHQGIKLDLMYIPGEKNRLQNLLTEISNALNHKP